MAAQAIDVFIEIPQGSKIKYELDKKLNSIRADRILTLAYPFNYGFIPNTLWGDGDPLDVILVGDFSLHPGTTMAVYPRASILLEDNGQSDDKIICTASPEEPYEFMMSEITEFLSSYKTGIDIRGVITDLEMVHSAIEVSKVNMNHDDFELEKAYAKISGR